MEARLGAHAQPRRARVQPTNFRAASASDEAPSSSADVTAVGGAARTSNEPSARKGPRRLAKNSPSSGGNERRRASRSVGSMSLRTARAAVREAFRAASRWAFDGWAVHDACDGDGRRYGVCVCSSPRSWASLESVGASVAGGVGTVVGTIAAVLPLACRLRLLSDSRGRG